MFSRFPFKLFQPEETKSLIEANTLLIQNKLLERKNGFLTKVQRIGQYQDRFRTYSVLASKGRLNPTNATSLLNQEFPEQEQTTLKTMNSLFPL